MPFDIATGQWREDVTDPMGGQRQRQPGPGYNNPWYDQQQQGQAAQGGSLQPMPAAPQAPTYTGDMGGIGGGMNYTNPPYNPDHFGGGSGNFDNFNPQDQGRTVDRGAINNLQAGGLQLYQPQQMQNPAPPVPGTMNNPDAAFPKFDPGFLSQIQSALESPNGPWANRQPGDYGPQGSPDFVRNPMGDEQWKARFYWFAAHPEALNNPSAPMAAAGPSVPWQNFTKDVYSDVNANRSFNELSGVVDDSRLQQAQTVYGWQLGPSGLASNEAALSQANQMKSAHPEFSYQVYQRPDGTYGIAARELDAASQEKRGYISPATATRLAQERAAAQSKAQQSRGYSGGGGGGYGGGYVKKPTGTTAGINGNFNPPKPGTSQVWDDQTQAAIDGAPQSNGPALTPQQQAMIDQWAATHPYSGPYSPQNMPAAPQQPAPVSTGPAQMPNGYNPTPPVGTLSPDGGSIWDGQRWVPRGAYGQSPSPAAGPGDGGGGPGGGANGPAYQYY